MDNRITAKQAFDEIKDVFMRNKNYNMEIINDNEIYFKNKKLEKRISGESLKKIIDVSKIMTRGALYFHCAALKIEYHAPDYTGIKIYSTCYFEKSYKTFHCCFSDCTINIKDNGESYITRKAWVKKENRKNIRGDKEIRSIPLNLSDLGKNYYLFDNKYKRNLELYKKEFYRLHKDIVSAILETFSNHYYIWKDIKKDFEKNTSYFHMPVVDVCKYKNKKELIEAKFGKKAALNRTNKDTIGQSAFYHCVKKTINPDEVQKLYNFIPVKCLITNRKLSLIKPLTEYLENQIRFNGNVNDRAIIEDMINMSIILKDTISLHYTTWEQIKRKHDELTITIDEINLPEVKIPKKSRFENLTMPDDCIQLTTKRMFVEESRHQSNCVSSYIYGVNTDECSIWSQRLKDGTRNTIEIVKKGNKFAIRQMLGRFNKPCKKADYKRVKDAINLKLAT